ncbi:MAG TPA: hypothetical protein GXX37_11340 [Clostridiaceae bacterium]|nr:hypothetical protein [Clostridiaceae bacterium]
MKRRFIVIFLLLALMFAFVACTALQLNTEKVKVIEKEDSNGATVTDKSKVENENNGNAKVDEKQNSGNITASDKDKDKDKNVDKNTNTGTKNSDLDDKADALQADTEEYIKSIIEERAREVLTAIKNYDMSKLADAIHPDKGIRFSPYGYVDVDNDLVFTAEEVRNLDSDSKTYLWGYYDGSGEPITLNFSDYYKKFIYDVDFLNAEQVGYNKILGQGNSLNNSSEVYKNSIIVEYHFSGFDPQYNGMDWRSLRLAFEKKGDIWYLVAIIHDQWTI